MSWREFRFNLRPIALLAVGCVVFTTVAVAAVAHALLGAAVGRSRFLLGAIISPPDVVAPLAIARRLGLPRRSLVILEGEGLANDATALILYRFAVAAVSTGAFALGPGARHLRRDLRRRDRVRARASAGRCCGCATRRAIRASRSRCRCVTPYLAFWVPEHLGGSGVLATVACGLYISWNGPLLIAAATRLQGVFFWDLFTYLIEGMVFLLTGLQARTLVERIGELPGRRADRLGRRWSAPS